MKRFQDFFSFRAQHVAGACVDDLGEEGVDDAGEAVGAGVEFVREFMVREAGGSGGWIWDGWLEGG